MKKIGDLLREYLRDKGWLSQNPYAALFQEWTRIAGDALAGHCRLLDIEDGVLLVEVDHPGWMQMLQLRRKSLLDAARKAAPQARIEGLRIHLGH